LSTGDVDSPFGQLLQNQRLGDPLMVILIKDMAFQGDAEVTALNIFRENTDQCFSLERSIARETVTGVVELDQQILDAVILIPQQWCRCRRTRNNRTSCACVIL